MENNEQPIQEATDLATARPEILSMASLVLQQAQAFVIETTVDCEAALDWRNELQDRDKAVVAKLAKLTGLEQSELQADTCEPAIDMADRKVRLVLTREGKMLAFVLTSPENAYDLASSILNCYDKIEGI